MDYVLYIALVYGADMLRSVRLVRFIRDEYGVQVSQSQEQSVLYRLTVGLAEPWLYFVFSVI